VLLLSFSLAEDENSSREASAAAVMLEMSSMYREGGRSGVDPAIPEGRISSTNTALPLNTIQSMLRTRLDLDIRSNFGIRGIANCLPLAVNPLLLPLLPLLKPITASGVTVC
jgi:hypothetical protein